MLLDVNVSAVKDWKETCYEGDRMRDTTFQIAIALAAVDLHGLESDTNIAEFVARVCVATELFGLQEDGGVFAWPMQTLLDTARAHRGLRVNVIQQTRKGWLTRMLAAKREVAWVVFDKRFGWAESALKE